MAAVSEIAAGFGRALRAGGLDVPLSAVTSFAEALSVVGLEDPSAVFWSGHASFVSRPEDRTIYAETFARFFSDPELGPETGRPADLEARGGDPSTAEQPTPIETIVESVDSVDVGEDEEPGEQRQLRDALRYSRAEVLATKDFASCTPSELDELYRLMGLMRKRAPRRRTRRRVPVSRSRGAPDLRRTVRSSLRSGGEAARLHRYGRGERDRRIVLLVDVSGSMEPYARALLHFAHAAVAGRQRVEAFALGTRLTRITRQLSWRDPDAAIRRAAGSVPDLSGGTRLGDGLRSFNDRFGVAGFARGAVVVILSDGWDRGDPATVAEEMARLRRVAYRVIWVNPIKATPGYEPLARGMAAALPYVDEFLDGHSLEALETLVEVMAR